MSQLDQKATPHHTRWCNGCKSDKYPGKRYACKECDDFDLCQRCYDENRFSPNDSAVTHKSSHKMVYHELESKSHNSNDTWTAMSIKMQNYFGSTLGKDDWCKYDTDIKEEWTNLAKKIGFAIYGPPTIIPSSSNSSYYGYDDKKEKHIMSIRNHVLELNRKAWKDEKVYMNVIYVSFWSKDYESMLPIIRVFRKKDDYLHSYFVEPEGRTYDSWSNFLDKNKLPECEICYPDKGWYEPDENGYCELKFRDSAECDTSRQLAKAGDIISTGIGIGGTVLGVIGLFTPLAPVAATTLTASLVSTGVYGTARATYQLTDRVLHGESINPFDNSQAFFHWLSIAGSIFAVGFSAGASASFYAGAAGAAGRNVGQATRIAINAALVGSLTTNYIGIVANVINIVERFKSGEVPALEIFQLTASVLFFTNTLLTIQTAGDIVKNAQKAQLEATRNQLTDLQKVNFDLQVIKDQDAARDAGATRRGQVERRGAQITIGRLNDLMTNTNWQDYFGNTNNVGNAALKHTAQPTHLSNGAGVVMENQAIAQAKHAHVTRYNGKGANKPSSNTIIALPQHELDLQIGDIARTNNIHNGPVSLPGSYYGYQVTIDGNQKVVESVPIRIENPTFKWDGNKGYIN
uniref:ZZ-type domain-containing protein n=1 Tax=Panagrolaimus sp. ES5 TaxID=591445 RepID=A0AC34FCH5_9BILA